MAKISNATKRNFAKLNKNIEKHKFVSRANKHDSCKNIIPFEYYTNSNNIEKILKIVDKLKNKDINKSINSLIISLLIDKGLINFYNNQIVSNYPFVKIFIEKLDFYNDIVKIKLPIDEKDPIGLIYQHLIKEGEKNKKGSYYTPRKIVEDLLNNTYNYNETFCDPCCGTGSFLIEALKYFNPNNIYGFDIDNIAVNITKTNLFIKFPNIDFNKKIQNINFFIYYDQKFDCIITNPPWGSLINNSEIPLFSCINSKESFSYFIEHSLNLITEKGFINFLLPISILNVKVHKDIRDFIISNYKIEEIKIWEKCFKGVLTDVISIKISKNKLNNNYSYTLYKNDKDKITCPIKNVLKNRNHNILLLDNIELSIINKIENKAKLNLKKAKYALGIVTGNNKKLLKNVISPNLQPIITGKEISKYYPSKSKYFIEYKRENFQQVCPDYFFQEKTKFIYKFISRKLVFSLDENKMLVLNSANIMLIPNKYPLNKYVLLALLNSDLMNFYFIKVINQIKVLKEDIQNLPLPFLPNQLQTQLSNLVIDVIENKKHIFENIENIIFDYYELTKKEKNKIKETVYGTIK